jgi:hypothetical protein
VIALIATAFALVPVVVASQGATEATTWRVSGVLFALAFVPIAVVAWRVRLMTRRVGVKPVVPFVAETATVALLTIIGSTVVPNDADGLYMAGLFLVLVVSGGIFVMLMVTLLDGPD